VASTPASRRLALTQEARRASIERTAFRQLRRKWPAFRRLLAGAVREFDQLPDTRVFRALEPFMATLRAMSSKSFHAGRRDTINAAKAFAKENGMELPFGFSFQLESPEAIMFENAAGFIMPTIAPKLAQAINTAVTDATLGNATIPETVTALRAKVGNVVSPSVLQTWATTFAQISYAAGKYTAGQNPAIQSILWGYEYVTVGDERVRDEHAGFDGTRLPKSNEFWQIFTPPNGWNCRCSIIDIFEAEQPVAPHIAGGVEPSADPNFTFNPAQFVPAA